MPASPESLDTSVTDTPQPPAGRPRSGSTSRGRWRSWLKLVGSRRGQGAIVWSGPPIPAAYELDVFAAATTCSIQGALEGDFAPLLAEADADQPPHGVRLRLDDGREIAIDIVELEAGYADVTAVATPEDAAALVR
jgi:hypothetical protein